MTERPSRRERARPAEARSARWPESVLCGTLSRRAASPAGRPSGPASTRRRKAARRVGLARADRAPRAVDSAESAGISEPFIRYVDITRYIDSYFDRRQGPPFQICFEYSAKDAGRSDGAAFRRA